MASIDPWAPYVDKLSELFNEDELVELLPKLGRVNDANVRSLFLFPNNNITKRAILAAVRQPGSAPLMNSLTLEQRAAVPQQVQSLKEQLQQLLGPTMKGLWDEEIEALCCAGFLCVDMLADPSVMGLVRPGIAVMLRENIKAQKEMVLWGGTMTNSEIEEAVKNMFKGIFYALFKDLYSQPRGKRHTPRKGSARNMSVASSELSVLLVDSGSPRSESGTGMRRGFTAAA